MHTTIERTKDIEFTEDMSFQDMMLSPQVLAGLIKSNFKKPSPIQLRAIPIGRCGLDLIIQSKSGTGKTLVYCTIILERYKLDVKAPQSLIVVPTREIALQVEAYLNNIGSNSSGFNVTCVIGGRDISDDRKRINKCKAIVGTPGRLLHLIQNKFICLQSIEILVLDEADKLVQEDFCKDINILLDALNDSRQIIATSATYANGLDKQIVSFMQNPIAISTARETPVLIGVKQFLLNVDSFSIPQSVTNSNAFIQEMWRKVSAVDYVLSTTSFKQCILFSNSQLRAKSFANYLSQNKWTVELVLGSHDQRTRTATLEKFRQCKSRILITSDLMARGVDIANVNLVINLDVPSDSSTYLHRIGRCGRFGRKGLAITMIGDAIEMDKFRTLLDIIGGSEMNVATFATNLRSDRKFDAWNAENQSNSSDSSVLGIFNSDEMSSDIIEKIMINNNKTECESQNESSSLEQKNLKLLEVARLLVGNKPTQSSVGHIDADLFANFQHSTESAESSVQTKLSISVNLFEEFTQGKCNNNSREDQCKIFLGRQENCETLLNGNSLEKSSCLKKPDQDLEKEHQPIKKTLKCNDPKNAAEKMQNIPANFKHPKIQYQIHTDSNLATNGLWTKLYWQQLSDINQYVKHSSYMFK